MVRDLEELLLSVLDDLSRDYLREAVRCYHAGAFRAATVLAVAACMDDLRRKVHQLKITGAGAEITKLSDSVDKKHADQDTWENDLLEGCGARGILSPSEQAKLGTILKTRHLCAHPSGHAGSAEEARDVIATCVDLVLSRPPQVGGAEIEALVSSRLPHPNFFGTGDPKAIETAVTAELARFHAHALKGLVARMGRVLASEAPGSVLQTNAVRFLGGMVANHSNQPARKLAWEVIGNLLTSPVSATVLPILSQDPAGLSIVEEVVRYRALGLVKSNLREIPAQGALSSWLTSGNLTSEERTDFLARLKSDFLSMPYITSPASCASAVEAATALAQRLQWPDLSDEYAEWLIGSASHGDFHVENAATAGIRDIPASVAKVFSKERQARAVMSIIRAASHGARTAQAACRSGLTGCPEFVDSFVAALQAKEIEFSGFGDAWEHAERLLVATRGAPTALAVAKGIVDGSISATNQESVILVMSKSRNSDIAALAAPLLARLDP